MQIWISRFFIGLALAVTAAGLHVGCAAAKSHGAQKGAERVTLAQLSEPARATVLKETAGGRVDRIDREVERGKTVYDVETTVGGRHVEFLIADTDGAVLGTEIEVEFSQLPEAVRRAAEEFFGMASGLKAMKGVEFGETHYEIEGQKDGKTAEVTFDPTGRRSQ